MRATATNSFPADSTASVNMGIAGSLITMHIMVLIALPFLLAWSPWWALTLVPAAAMSVVHWGLIHEAIHKLLFADSHANEQAGRLLGVLMGASFHVLRFGHLMHHKLNRDWHSERVAQRNWRTRLEYYANLFFGLYLSEFLTGLLLTVLPHRLFMRVARSSLLRGYEEVAIAGERFFWQRGNIHDVRHDVLAMLIVYGVSFWLYAEHWPVLLGFLAARAFVISFLDNIYHYATPADNSKAGKELSLPGGISRLLLHSNYHETHHTNPHVPWRDLPAVHTIQNRAFDGRWLTHARLQFAGPVVD